MDRLKTDDSDVVGVIGAGRFGTAIATLVSKNSKVLTFTRRLENIESINENNIHSYLGYELPKNITATNDIEYFCSQCKVIFPVVPSEIFRGAISEFAPFLTPEHILIHGIKGLDVDPKRLNKFDVPLLREDVHTMSEIIEQETQVIRIGCLSGPNLSMEIMDNQPTATVIASQFDEVVEVGKRLLKSNVFRVFESKGIKGAELAGAFKNIVAIGSGILFGRGYGKNIQAMIITKGLSEIIFLGKAFGITPHVFLGTAGLGDLIATATSQKSRNFQFGIKLGEGAKMSEILEGGHELAEGVRTIKIAYRLMRSEKLRLPILTLLYKLVFDNYSLDEGMKLLMNFPYDIDVGFLD